MIDVRAATTVVSALAGRPLPDVRLPSTQGKVELRLAAAGTLVLFIYPRTGVAGQPQPAGWDEIPGARGCTAESCAFRDRATALHERGANVMGLSAQPAAEQREFAQRERIPYPLLNDCNLVLANELGLPTFEVAGMTFYKRLTLIAVAGRVATVFYPVVSPARHPAEVVEWLSEAR